MDQAPAEQELTVLLNNLSGGGERAFGELIDTVYDELRKIAAKQMKQQFNRDRLDGLTQQPTEVVHEAVIRLAEQYAEYQNRGHFFAIASRLIRWTIQDYQRRRMAAKRGHGQAVGELDEQAVAGLEHSEHLLELSELIERLENEDPRAAEVVSMRLFADLGMKEIAEKLDISLATAERDWRYGRAFLKAGL
jgi:RNA polymerase sigma factor (TIGR02999 family)